MTRPSKPDPYNGFKDDRERRRALNVRAICFAIAWSGAATGWGAEAMRWLSALTP